MVSYIKAVIGDERNLTEVGHSRIYFLMQADTGQEQPQKHSVEDFMAEFGPFERVYVENNWYDGPREGIAEIDGVPHRFQSLFDESEDEYLSTFEVWPVSQEELELEIEQWGIFVHWNMRYESGDVGTESHPAHGGLDFRWDEIAAALKVLRQEASLNVRHAKAQIKPANKAHRYEVSGPDYLMSWKFL